MNCSISKILVGSGGGVWSPHAMAEKVTRVFVVP